MKSGNKPNADDDVSMLLRLQTDRRSLFLPDFFTRNTRRDSRHTWVGLAEQNRGREDGKSEGGREEMLFLLLCCGEPTTSTTFLFSTALSLRRARVRRFSLPFLSLLQCRRSSAAGAPRRRSSPIPPSRSLRPRSSSTAARCPGRSWARRRQASGKTKERVFSKKKGCISQGRKKALALTSALFALFLRLGALLPVAESLSQSRSSPSIRRKTRMRTGERPPDAF